MNMPTREELVNAVKFGINSHVVKTSQISAILGISFLILKFKLSNPKSPHCDDIYES